MKKTVVLVKNMDCPCEENMIKMKLAGFKKIFSMGADIGSREFSVVHNEDESEILKAIDELNLGSSHISTTEFNDTLESASAKDERRILLWVLLINFTFFIIEIIYGILANSMGLIADSLDMLSDSLVYIMAFFAVYATLTAQKRVAFAAGIFQACLAAFGFLEVVRRFIGESYEIDYKFMIIVSLFALFANYICLRLLNKNSSDKPHIKASQIFTSNDIVINLGVVIAGLLVLASGSNLPDLIIGAVVFIVVLRGAIKILKLAK